MFGSCFRTLAVIAVSAFFSFWFWVFLVFRFSSLNDNEIMNSMKEEQVGPIPTEKAYNSVCALLILTGHS